MKSFIGTCVGNPFDRIDTLCTIVDDADEITKDEFLSACYVDDALIKEMELYQDSYTFSRYDDIYFFTWSAIEHFYN